MLKIAAIEVCEDDSVGSIGFYFVISALRRNGFIVDVMRNTKEGYDIELLSVHHCSNFLLLPNLKQRSSIRIIGGHPMQNNPRPVIRYCDAVFIGEGEVQIIRAMSMIAAGKTIEDVCNTNIGWVLSKSHNDGDVLPPANIERELPVDNPVYLNFEGTNSASWYIEAARGCPFKCAYCELGNSSKYRKHDFEYIKKCVDQTDPNITKKINLFAPDEASLPYYDEFLKLIHSRKMYTQFSSVHFKTIINQSKRFKQNHLFRLGLDGMTEQTRFRVGKKIKDIDVINFFMQKTEEGYVQFKLFMIFGYPWDTVEDFDQFRSLMDSVFSLHLKKNVSLRIKWTPFIPQPCTPLGSEMVEYRFDILEKILGWHEMVKTPRNQNGFHVRSDGIMERRRYDREIALCTGDENILNRIASADRSWI